MTTHIITALQGDGVITVLDPLSGTTQQTIHTGMQIQDIKIIDNTIFMVDMHRLVGWQLEADGMMMPGAYDTKVIDEPLPLVLMRTT